MRITRRGVLVLLSAPVFCALAWGFGLPEAAVLAVGAVALVLGAWVWVVVQRPDLDVRRTARPARCQVDDACQIRLRSVNLSRRRSPVVSLSDDAGRHGIAQLQLGPLRSGEAATATYSLPTDRRGLHRVGPLQLTVEDPFRLARATTVDASHVTVFVLPRIWPLTPLQAAPGDEPEQGVRALTSLSTVDEEFSSLRSYVPGDDIRRIHWRTTARTGNPVMREFDLPWQHRTTVVLDVSAAAYDVDSFERAVSTAASLVALAATRGELIRLVCTGSNGVQELDSGFVGATERVDALMDRLAAVEMVEDDAGRNSGRLVATVRGLGASGSGRLVICAGAVDGAEMLELDRVSSRFGLKLLVSTRGEHPGATAGSPPSDRRTSARMAMVQFDGSEPLTPLWARATAQLVGVR